MPEPPLDDDRYVEQDAAGHVAVPLTITDDGQVYGHLAYWGECHVGYPGACVTPPASPSAYAHFHVGEVRVADGGRVATGVLSVSCDHADLHLFAGEARDHYAHAGLAWADVRVSDGQVGPWVAGALRAGLTDEQVRVLRASSLSGDWRRIGGQLDLVAVLSVNTPGFPIAREALAASALALPDPRSTGVQLTDGVQTALVSAGRVTRCRECAARAARRGPGSGASGSGPELEARLARMERSLAAIERRTRHMIDEEVARLAVRLGRG
jgi:hypothetical protein